MQKRNHFLLVLTEFIVVPLSVTAGIKEKSFSVLASLGINISRIKPCLHVPSRSELL